MKRSQVIGLLAVACIPIGIYVSSLFASTTSVENEVQDEVTVEIETVEVDSIEKRIDEAKAAAMADIEAEANQMRDEFIANELKTVEAAVLAEIEGELKERRTGVEKATGAY